MMFLEEVNNKIAENKTEMITSLSKLVSIPSVAVEENSETPFGKEVDRAYKEMMELARKEDFQIYNADNYGGHIDFTGQGNEIIGVAGHLDVVPEGRGWDHEPYGGEVIDEKIHGRGTTDDKGPVIATFYAMKALKECGYKPKRTIRLILGLDEETNWNGMKYYLSKVNSFPNFGFTPDGDFPAIHGEMGIIVFDFIKKFSPIAKTSEPKGLKLVSIKGGVAANSVPDFARAVINNLSSDGYYKVKEEVASFKEETGYSLKYKGIGKSFEIVSKGIAAHGARPDTGLNAISIMMNFLGKLNFAAEETNDFISFYNNYIGYDLHGERLGCSFEDIPSGKLILNVGMIDLDKKDVKLTINVRYPVTLNEDVVYDGVIKEISKYDIGILKGKHQKPIYLSKDEPLIRILMEAYSNTTGDKESEPIVIGGGTYARAFDNMVAFGGRFPGEKELMHQKNEYISIENLMKLTRIYAESIYKLSEME